MASPTKERVLLAAASLIRRQGYAGTGLKEIASASDARWSSLYHFFPNGKEQLVAEALVSAGMQYDRVIERLFDEAHDAAGGARAFFELSAEALARSDYADGCPIATAALEAASTSEPVRRAAERVFAFWIQRAAAKFEADGLPPARAYTLATFGLSALEGAILLSRTMRSTQPLIEGGTQIEGALRALAYS